MVWRKAQADMRRLAQQYDMQAAYEESSGDAERAAELRKLAEATRGKADELKPKE